ncbi:MAG: TPM domain-containing protein, partial [Salinibacterium amurskyense]
MKARLGTTLALAALLGLLTTGPALANDPVSLDGGYVVDSVGVLDGDSSAIDGALDSLYESQGIQLFVVYVDEFTNPSDPVDWADTTADNNGLGDNDLLLAVAVSQRQYALAVSPDAELSDAQLDAAESAIEAELRVDNWGEAAIAGANSLAGGGIPILPIVGGVAVVGAGAYVIYRVRRGGKGDRSAAPAAEVSQEELDRRAGSALVDLDDAVKTSEQELGFAEAQFGSAATAGFQKSLDEANAAVAKAFRIRQQL